jgi:hypothetical protein
MRDIRMSISRRRSIKVRRQCKELPKMRDYASCPLGIMAKVLEMLLEVWGLWFSDQVQSSNKRCHFFQH